MNLTVARPRPEPPRTAPPASREGPGLPSTVATSVVLEASPAEVWKAFVFYEEIERRPPFYLRLLLPAPVRTIGRKSKVGDEAFCVYQGGQILKRVTRIEPGARYEFEVVEQNLHLGGGLQLQGGGCATCDLGNGRTEVTLTTRFASPRRPRGFWGPVESAVCHGFHRFILGEIRRKVGSGGTPGPG